MKKFSLKKLVTAVAVTTSLVAAATISASACTTIYVGAEKTVEKTPFVARTEDYGWNYNKQWFVMPEGKWAKGDTFLGCPGYGEFEWKFTHDSYRFTYFTNDQYQGTCPECGQENATHPSYTEFGTNEKGVSVSATETIYGRSEVTETIDPFVKTKVDGKVGIEETDIPTIILSEANSAKAGVDLLLSIYKDYGAYFASGVFICDQNETWYIENCSGHEYVAIKVPDSMIFLEPNMAVIGRVDLDDTDNVISSENLIKVAQEAKTFVGDAKENIIDFRASYAGRQDRVDQRMVDGLNYLNKNYNYTAEQLLADNTRFTISNVNDKDEQVGLYTNIKADRTLDKNDVFGYYKLSSIGKPSNQDIEIFQLFKNNDVTTGTVGWVGVGNMSNNVFVPYYPMLLTDSKDMYEGYQATLPAVQKVAERPADANAFFVNDKKGGFAVYPEGWRNSYYFSFEGLGGYIADAEAITGTAVSAADKQYVQDKMTALQNEFNETFAKVELKNATETSRQMAAKAHATALAMIDYLTEGSFNDVAAGSWYADAVKNVVNKGLMAGTGKDTFAPDNQVTRAMMWTVLARLDGKDVSGASTWYAKAMTWATEKGVSDGTFPGNSITREQLATMLWRAAGSPEAKGALTNFNDAASVSSWAAQAMTWAVEQGLISGMGDGALNPQGNATRAQLAVILTAYAK
ncbi:C69 family dipeptidase [Lawsonibacter sp. DFI.6.74]|nr:C69 family dipeptidase [Lawsonibacter sp. DFI.6.74]MCG4774817.1 C69 family dipeptidase [Lawsonibacter sp. DFI.5.51]